MSDPVRVLLIGAGGRMGKAIIAAADSRFAITEAERGANLLSLTKSCDVAIDFSTADATEAVCAACAAQKRPLVLGTTGHTEAQKEAVRATAEQVGVVFAANFSLGVNVLFALARKTASLLGEKFDVEVVEAHHHTKKDAPSGTAKRIVEILEGVRGSSVPVHSIRAGGIVGDHEVIFAGSGEQLALTHRASSRATFAEGALHAALWVVDKPAGLYRMEDVLGL
jgi:4-hydroxy-tetrahydrodipicolinate reductase